MDLTKHLDFFSPLDITEQIHIIGCGAIGSNVALQLAKLGCNKLFLWDFDTVDEHNITNQVYDETDLGQMKTEALKKHLINNNKDIKVYSFKKYTDQLLQGYIFVCVDSIELRKHIYECNQYNEQIKLVIDGRIGLDTGQVYAVDWSKEEDIKNLIELSDFKSNEIDVPVSACGTTLSVSPTVLITISNMISVFINFKNEQKIPKIININAFKFKTNTIY